MPLWFPTDKVHIQSSSHIQQHMYRTPESSKHTDVAEMKAGKQDKNAIAFYPLNFVHIN